MEKIIQEQSLTGNKETYRIIIERYMFHGYVISIQKKIKFLGLIPIWITVKEFNGYEYDDIFDSYCDECLGEAIEVYNKLINTYGKL